MKSLRLLTIGSGLICFLLLQSIIFGQTIPVSPALQEQVKNLINASNSFWEQEDINGFMSLLDEDFHLVFTGAGKEDLKKILEKLTEGIDYTKADSTIKSIERKDNFILVRTTDYNKYRKGTGKEEEETTNMIYFLQERDGRLLITSMSRDIEEGAFDPVSRIYKSKKGKYAIHIPQKWMPLGCPFGVEQMTPDAVVALAPDYKSCALLGFVQLPIPVEAKQAVEADEGAMKKVASEHKILEQGEVKVGGLPGYRTVSEFTIEGQHRTRERVYFTHKPFLYFFVFDALLPAKYEGLKQDFGNIVQSFRIIQPEEGLSLKDEVVAEFGQGNISGRVYTNEEYNCFIAAPEGWELITSANPAHLAEMHYKQGKSIARLIGAKGQMAPSPSVDVHELVEERTKGLKKILDDFQEHSRRDVTIQGVPAVESVQSYSLEGVGHFKVKEVTLMKNGIFYLILCQAIEPDKYETVEKDFDRIIASFGFIK
jgi:hypothetical protein